MQPLAGTEKSTYPFWSGDSRHIGFFAEGKLKRISIDGGPPVTICAAPLGRGGTWHGGVDGVIVFAANQHGPLSSVAASGGEPQVVTALDPARKEAMHRVPQFLPDGRRFLYIAADSELSNAAVSAGELPASGAKPSIGKLVVQSDSEAMWSLSGHLLFLRENTLFAQAYDPNSWKAIGEPTPVAESVESGTNRHTAAFSISATGALVFREGGEDQRPHRLAWLDRSGKEIAQISGGENLHRLSLSPDGKFAAGGTVSTRAASGDIWLLDLERGSNSRFTFDPRAEDSPTWSPDGKRIAYRAIDPRSGDSELLMKSVSGVGQPESILKGKGQISPTGWSSDGKWLFYSGPTANSKNTTIFGMQVDGDRKPVQLVATDFNSWGSQPSPDGRFFAYVSVESGRPEIYVRTFAPNAPNTAGKWQISNGTRPGGVDWSADGKEIYFADGKGQMVSVPVKASGASLQVGAPVALFELKNSAIATRDRNWFLGVLQTTERERPSVNVVLNWTAALPARR